MKRTSTGIQKILQCVSITTTSYFDLLQNSTSHESKVRHNDCSLWCHLDAAEANMPETPAMEAQSYSTFLLFECLENSMCHSLWFATKLGISQTEI